ncbi:MAG: bifunctional diaminohydroxyphosphoribosylaminopyrimidine deaminase/5-amino-6-(5-phosphoribosylamino)uracil reductase RibD [Bdellovibrionota bacterium]
MAVQGLSPLNYGYGLGGIIARGIDAKAATPYQKPMSEDERFMSLALLEAMEAIGRSCPNPSVGAVIVKDGTVIAKASTQDFGQLHAETMALSLAPPHLLQGATCYVTLEPCGGRAKQGPCAEALIAAGITRVVVAATDPNEKAAGLGLQKLREAGVSITLDCLAAEAKAWHFPFLAYQLKKSPIIIGKWAQTLDGHLADDQGNSQWISGPRSRAYTHWLRQKYDSIMVGVHTVLNDHPRLTARDSPLPHARHPCKIVFDPSGRMETATKEAVAALLDEADSKSGPVIYWCTEPKVSRYPTNLLPHKDKIIHLPTVNFSDWSAFFRSLSDEYQQRFGRYLQSIMVEGGSQLLTLLMRSNQLDAAHIFVRAGFLGGARNRIAHLHQGQNPSLSMMQRHDYRLITSQQIDDDVVLECVQERLDLWAKVKA